MITSDVPVPQEQIAFVTELGRRYLWWEPVGGQPHAFDRVVAQIMNLGTYEDIRRLEARIDADTLAAVMRQAQPGWFGERSWDFWKGRLASSTTGLPERAPRRAFADAAPV